MSKHIAQAIPVVQYTSLSDLLQEVHREAHDPLPTTVRVGPMVLTSGGWRIWGILISALPAATIHAAWVVADAAHTVTCDARREAQALSKQNRLSLRVVAIAEQYQCTVRPGAYVVPDGVFRSSATLPADLPTRDGEGGQ